VGWRALLAAVLVALTVTVPAASASTAAAGYTVTPEVVTASDNTQLACLLIEPDGATAQTPGIVLFHGLGQSSSDMAPIGVAFSQFGFASLACDARGTGNSGGQFGLDGPTEVQDAQDLYDWFAVQPGVSDTQIGAMGFSLGGGEVWNSAVAGVPWKAIVPAITWTNLATALNPNNVPKTGLLGILSQAVPIQNWIPSLQATAATLLQGQVTPSVTAAEASRSSRTQLHSLTTPTLLLQGRHDFLFDIDQALAAYKLLAGPKRLYIGDLGHPPAPNPAAETNYYILQAVVWFGHYLAGQGLPGLPKAIAIAHDPWDGSTNVYKNGPKTRHEIAMFPGKSALSAAGMATRSVKLTGGPLETYGDSVLTVHYSGASQWTHLVATLSVKGSTTPITEGAAPISKASGIVKIRLMNEAVLLPRGKKLVVTLAAKSIDDTYHLGIPTWDSPEPDGAKITIRSIQLNLSLLKKTISR
jgi:pimeloyl-ACP methyl ester carboxylesterase